MTAVRLALLALLFTAGCDDQVGGDYLGDTEATFSGTIVGPPDRLGSHLGVAMVWHIIKIGSPGGSYLAAEPARVSGGFPATFSLSLYRPPPEWAIIDDGLFDPNGGAYALGYLLAHDTRIVRGEQIDLERLDRARGTSETWGVAEGHFIVYVKRPPKPGAFIDVTGLAEALMTPGYGLVAVTPPSETTGRGVVTRVATTESIPLRVGTFDELRFPDFL